MVNMLDWYKFVVIIRYSGFAILKVPVLKIQAACVLHVTDLDFCQFCHKQKPAYWK